MTVTSLLEKLPDEIFLHILSFLESRDVVILQSASKHFLGLCRDGNFWRDRSLSASAVSERIRLSRLGSDWIDEDGATLTGVPTAAGQANQTQDDQNAVHWNRLESLSQLSSKRRKREQARIAANWDPTFPNEKTNWYNEYIHRYGPIAVSWFEQPQVQTGSIRTHLDASGIALYNPPGGNELFAVSPLDDGSICLWDVKGTRSRKGSILSRSNPGLLCADGPGADLSRRSKMINTGVTECVSIDSVNHVAFFAIQSNLIEVDLKTLQVVEDYPFEWSITTLSPADPNVPLTVGTIHGLHFHDSRARSKYRNEHHIQLDNISRKSGRNFSHVLDPRPLAPYASLAQSGPQSILHLGRSDTSQLSDDIFVAGRFSNILHYDRRMFPTIKGSVHSGARLCSLTSLPFPFATLYSDLRQRILPSDEPIEKGRSTANGRTLIACGEYSTKGSLELYGLSPGADDSPREPVIQKSSLKNRQTASQSKLLSVMNHGTRIVFSDGQGYLKWVERDGFTEVRRHKIGKSERVAQRSLFGSMPGSDDIARKILSTRTPGQDGEIQANDEDILFWTGERLGMLSFSSQPGFSPEDFEENTRTPEDIAAEEDEQMYGERMRLALERQARDVRFVQNLGAGSLHSGI
ncbi:hypothetical protein GL218_05978 [Daldinia childiae]|uniref:uncharacterized protein n=1 Tax=Daldinia childiae TaxID=326645 RepID=UPI001444B7FB|nr:uncharacterized protein GL218_05978 [Daldinia childiae]KAF3057102.1 hypothetical protein GL218_05978 [Daldinia childiae]